MMKNNLVRLHQMILQKNSQQTILYLHHKSLPLTAFIFISTLFFCNLFLQILNYINVARVIGGRDNI